MATNDNSIPTSVNQSLIKKNISHVSTLWRQRMEQVNSDYGRVSEISELESSIEQQLNCLYAFPEPVWEYCEQTISENGLDNDYRNDYGNTFVISMIAFRSLNVSRIQATVEFALADYDRVEELIDSLSWMPKELTSPWIEKFIKSKSLDHKYIAMSVYSYWRKHPGEYLATLLQREDCVTHEAFLSVSLRLIGELKLREFLPRLNSPFPIQSSAVAFWATWSSILMGKMDQASKLEGFVSYPGPFQLLAINIFFRVVSVDIAYRVISTMMKIAGNTRSLIRASIVLGDPKAIPWLINQMSVPEHARVAGGAFSMITGIDLQAKDLVIDIPVITALNYKSFEQAEESDISCEGALPWPDFEKIKVVWDRYGHQFSEGKRYLFGEPISAASLKKYIDSDELGVRRAAALELALVDPSSLFTNTNVFK